MSLSEKSILEFKKIFEKTYNVKISHEFAEEAAENLINFYKVVFEIDAQQRERETFPETEAITAP